LNAAPLLALTYTTVLTAELLGDKMIFGVASLIARYPTRAVFAGLVPAQMLKMAAAVLFGAWLMSLPRSIVIALSAITFAAAALALWRRDGHESATETAEHSPRSMWHGALLGFSTVFFTEWGDVGQIATAALVTRYGSPWIVWSAATAALVTKGALAATLGRGLTRYVPTKSLRVGATALCVVLAIANGKLSPSERTSTTRCALPTHTSWNSGRQGHRPPAYHVASWQRRGELWNDDHQG
jgi:putative Ca2+/H+ antiporter (TMEM165/GDT1 family)